MACFHLGRVALLIILGALLADAAKKTRFDGHVVLRVVPETDDQLNGLRRLQEHAHNLGLDFWTEPRGLNIPVDVRVAPEAKFPRIFFEAQFPKTSVMIADLQSLIDQEKVAPVGSKMAWDQYQQLDTIYAWLDEMAAAHPDDVSVEVIGQSFEGRDMKVLKIARPSSDGSEKSEVFIEGNIHAREWITSATVTYMINKMLNSTDYDDILEKFNLHIVVMSNPDGFQFTHEANRMWRKTRAETDSFWGCLGVDGNRNWDTHWGEAGSSGEPCSDTYHGPAANSEPEVKSQVDYVTALIESTGKPLSAFISYHSYSQLMLLPWGYAANPKPDNFDQLVDMSAVVSAAIAERYGTEYVYGNSVEILYEASGGSYDWGMEKAGAPFALGFELRDTGHYGFVLPVDQIIPSGEETLDGLAALLRYVAQAEATAAAAALPDAVADA